MHNEAMGPWKSEVIETVLKALAADRGLRQMLVFKGGRVLARRLGKARRQSLDLDANLRQEVVARRPDRDALRAELEARIEKAVRRGFQAQKVIRFELERVRVESMPPSGHPFGWDAFRARLNVRDLSMPGERGFPKLVIDIAAPEVLGPQSVAELRVGKGRVHAYTLERIMAEKLRAFLSSLPAYRRKFPRSMGALVTLEPIRVKDVFDIAATEEAYPISKSAGFWSKVLHEFRIACGSRGVDCEGLATFEEALDETRDQYEKDPALQSEIPFETAWQVVRSLCRLMKANSVTPFSSPLESTPE